jgi:hypothetical protein
MQIARHHSWKTWGWKEYVAVLEAAWRTNVTLGPGKPRLRVVGLDLPIDMPSIALAGLGDDAIQAPFWERVRAVRLIRELPKMLLRDAYMARQAELQLLHRGERGIVWVGAAHSTINCPRPGPAGPGSSRLGYMLKMKYPLEVYQVAWHGAFVGPDRLHEFSSLDRFLDRVIEKHGKTGIGFETLDSPFDRIRDSGIWPFRLVAEMSLGDLACGYLVLGPSRDEARCQWLEGYITEAMFAENRAFYTAKGRQLGVDVHNATDAEFALARQ